MAEKNIQIKNLAGDLLFPKTKGAVVINNAGENLGAVEAGAQVNKIETIKLNGVALNIVDKAVDVVIPAAVEYTIVKAETAEEGMSATYQLAKDGVAFGTKINIAKDMVVSGGTLKKCTEADSPVAGLAIGDPYIELTIANNDGTKLYIPVKDLVDVYTAGDATIDIADNKIKVNLTELQKTFYTETEVDTLLAAKVDATTLTTELAKKLDVTTYNTDKETFAIKTEVTTALAGKVDTTAYDTKVAALEAADAARYTKTEVDTLIADFLTYEELA